MLRKKASVGVFPNRQTIVNCFISLVFITASAQRLKAVVQKLRLPTLGTASQTRPVTFRHTALSLPYSLMPTEGLARTPTGELPSGIPLALGRVDGPIVVEPLALFRSFW